MNYSEKNIRPITIGFYAMAFLLAISIGAHVHYYNPGNPEYETYRARCIAYTKEDHTEAADKYAMLMTSSYPPAVITPYDKPIESNVMSVLKLPYGYKVNDTISYQFNTYRLIEKIK